MSKEGCCKLWLSKKKELALLANPLKLLAHPEGFEPGKEKRERLSPLSPFKSPSSAPSSPPSSPPPFPTSTPSQYHEHSTYGRNHPHDKQG